MAKKNAKLDEERDVLTDNNVSDKPSWRLCTPIQYLIMKGKKDWLRQVFDKKIIDVNVLFPCEVNFAREESNTQGKATPLMIATLMGNLDLIQLFLEFGANPFILSQAGERSLSACSLAIDSEQEDIVSFYLERVLACAEEQEREKQ